MIFIIKERSIIFYTKTKFWLCYLTIILQFSSCHSYRIIEDMYQQDADIIRLQHFDYYAQLLTKYYTKTGRYPFQHIMEYPIYIYIMTDVQEKKFTNDVPYTCYIMKDDSFFAELSNELDIEIIEKYDPQKTGTDGRPNMYVYKVHKDRFYFAVHLYYENEFSRHVKKYHNKLELSNIDDYKSKYYTYKTLINNPIYLNLISQKASKQGFFNNLDEQNKNDSNQLMINNIRQSFIFNTNSGLFGLSKQNFEEKFGITLLHSEKDQYYCFPNSENNNTIIQLIINIDSNKGIYCITSLYNYDDNWINDTAIKFSKVFGLPIKIEINKEYTFLINTNVNLLVTSNLFNNTQYGVIMTAIK